MFLIPCALLTALIAIFVIWASWGKSGSPPCVRPLEKGGRNPPPPVNFQKPAPTPDPPTKQYRTGNLFLRLPVPSECPRDLHYPCNDVHVEEFLREVYYK